MFYLWCPGSFWVVPYLCCPRCFWWALWGLLSFLYLHFSHYSLLFLPGVVLPIPFFSQRFFLLPVFLSQKPRSAASLFLPSHQSLAFYWWIKTNWRQGSSAFEHTDSILNQSIRTNLQQGTRAIWNHQSPAILLQQTLDIQTQPSTWWT